MSFIYSYIESELFAHAKSAKAAHRYLRFIRRFGNTGGKVRHHILPKAKDMWPMYSDLKEFPWNEVLLTERQHFIAHWILWKALGGSQAQSFYQMKNKDNQRLNSKSYEKVKNEHYRKHSEMFKDSDWLESVGKERAQKLSKIQIEIQNDSEWQLSIGKQKSKRISEKASDRWNNPEWIEGNKRVCEHCNESIFANIYSQYHGDKCKMNPNRDSLINKKECEHCGTWCDPGNYNKNHGDKCKMNPELTEEQWTKIHKVQCSTCGDWFRKNTIRKHSEKCGGA